MATSASSLIRDRAKAGQNSSSLDRTLNLSLAEGSLTQAFLNWTTGGVFTGYMLHLGASPAELALVASVPLLAQASSPFAAWLTALLGRRKAFTVATAALGRLLWLLAALLPQLGVPHALQPTFLVALVLVSSLFQASSSTLWATWMDEVVPAGQRGRYFGRRAGVVGLAGMVANLSAGWMLDRVASPLGFQVVLLAGVFCAALGVLLLMFHREPLCKPQKTSLKETLVLPWRDPNFRRFLVFALYWQGAVFIGAPFVFPYFISSLKLSFIDMALWSALAATCALLTTSQWGRIADQVGNKGVLTIGTIMAGTLLPACWILAGLTGNLGFIWLSAVFDALAWGAIGPALFNLALASAPKENRLAFIAMYSLGTGLSGFLGGLLSGPLLELLSMLNLSFWGYVWTPYHSLFALSGLLRAQAWLLLRPVQETNAWRTRHVLREVRFGWRGSGFFWR